MPKREPGFTKRLRAVRGEEIKESALHVQFCNACDSTVIQFDQNAFYTCSAVCDVFVCTNCAECSNGHSFKMVKNVPPEVGNGILNCSRCHN